MTARKHISLATKLASALLQITDENGVPLIPYAHAKELTASQIISLWAFDHYPIRHSDGGVSEPWNLVPRLILAHREKTAKKDAPEMAKDRKITLAAALHTSLMALKAGGRPADEQPRSMRKMASRPFSKKPNRSFRGKNAWAKI